MPRFLISWALFHLNSHTPRRFFPDFVPAKAGLQNRGPRYLAQQDFTGLTFIPLLYP